MNIVSVKTTSGQQDYLLKEDDKTVLKLRYKKDLPYSKSGNRKRKESADH
jgi:hypothetical protein